VKIAWSLFGVHKYKWQLRRKERTFISGPSCCAPPSLPAAAAPHAHPSAAGTTRLVFSEKAQHRQLLRRKNHIGSWTNPVRT
jgi:hypothetical protein